MYLFIFSVLAGIFIFVNSKGIIDKYEKDINTFKSKIEILENKVNELENKNFDLTYFTLEGSEEAKTYLEDKGLNIDDISSRLKDGLIEMNASKEVDHPIIPYASMTDGKIVIDQISILNHKWILADFTDGEHRGELFINYEVNDSGEISYSLKDYFLYPIN